MHRAFRNLPEAILVSPALAAVPMLALGLGAFAAQSPTYRLYVDAAFGFLLIAWPTIAMVGLPLHLVLVRFRFAAVSHAVAGAVIGLLLAWLSVDGSTGSPTAASGSHPAVPGGHPPTRVREAWTWLSCSGVALQGAMTGLLFFRRTHRGSFSRASREP